MPCKFVCEFNLPTHLTPSPSMKNGFIFFQMILYTQQRGMMCTEWFIKSSIRSILKKLLRQYNDVRWNLMHTFNNMNNFKQICNKCDATNMGYFKDRLNEVLVYFGTTKTIARHGTNGDSMFFLPTWINFYSAWISNHMSSKMWVKLLIISQTSTVQP